MKIAILSFLLAVGCVYNVESAGTVASTLKETEEMEMSTRNGMPAGHTFTRMDSPIPPLEADGGWYKFYFGAADTQTAYTFAFGTSDDIRISITDAYCPGDSFRLFRNGSYLITTPRVRSRGCKKWTDDPDKAFIDSEYSNTKFSHPGHFNLTIWAEDSPYNGGAAYIKADTRINTCRAALDPFVLINAPLSMHSKAELFCRKIGGRLAHITPNNAAAAAKSLVRCGHNNAWFGRLSLVPPPVKKSADLGCLAFNADRPADPTVEVLDCSSRLPILCIAD